MNTLSQHVCFYIEEMHMYVYCTYMHSFIGCPAPLSCPAPSLQGPQMELIDREVEVLQSLRHPHIIHLEEVLETPKVRFEGGWGG